MNPPAEPHDRNRSRTRRWISTIVGWTLAAAAAAYVVDRLSADPEPLHALRTVGPGELALLTVLVTVYLLAQAYRYLIVLERCAEKRVGFAAWLRLFFLGRFFGLLVPQAGNVYRGVALKRRFAVSYGSFLFASASFAWLDIVVNLLLTLGALGLWMPRLRLGGWRAIDTIALLTVAAVVAPMAILAVARAVASRSPRSSMLAGRVEALLGTTLRSFRDPRYLAWIVGLGVLLFVAATGIFVLCFHVLGHPVDPARAALFFLLLRTSVYLSLTPGNLGVLEIGFGALGGVLGIGVAEAILVSAMVRVAGSVFVALSALAIGGGQLLRRRRGTSPGDG